MTRIYTAWELIGFDGTTEVIDRVANPYHEARPAMVRIVGGRTLYESVGNDGGKLVRLSRLDASWGELRAVIRYVDPDTQLEVVEG